MRLRRRYLIVGGAGFIGSHFVGRLLAAQSVDQVTVYDNFSSGRPWHLEAHRQSSRLRVVRADVANLDCLAEAMRGHDEVIHLASNPDIARAASDPAADFRQGACLTHNVVEAMRLSGVSRILYASGSGVYGEPGEIEAGEDHGPLRPISTSGASKLAGEALICAYCHMFGVSACVFRFGNVVGPRQTCGVGFDLLRQLLAEPGRLQVQGDGTQSESYIHVSDVVEAVLLASSATASGFSVYNVATGDHVTVREIADLAVRCAGLPAGVTEYQFTGGDRGWKGDVPVVRLDISRIRDLGWMPSMSSREALCSSLLEILPDATAVGFAL